MYSNKYDIITGKWTNKRYMLLKKLGAGGIGEIYLVQGPDMRLYALKLSTDMVSITKEYKYLKKFGDTKHFPEVYELDDLEKKGKLYHFFTMEYIQGYTLKQAMKNNLLSIKAKFRIICILTKMLKVLNDYGYVYTDLKYENIMIDRRNNLLRLVDAGSITEIGRIVKEFTPMYDRASWGKGTRIADCSYQLFTLALLFLSMLFGRNLDPDKEKIEQLIKGLKRLPLPHRLNEVIKKSLDGRLRDCSIFYNEISSIRVDGLKLHAGLTAALNAAIIMLTVSLLLLGTIFVYR